ncbi:BspA family leucine-rich repeat surface protein [Vagococcus lutrae]|uniref:BspA family leucine-rich repeat surface protein n=1 Tax=Vagococcus lutrae TaxID=81947 RepID=A0AAE9XF66_9ENTE|nr:BspA family leucine-rich repeat surface protein [Vagococcus lutrae]WCG23087.1 BspA family leucine-rich repeat surface protein [Vagococcus lutrae]
MKKRALACLLLISIGLQPIASILATEAETSTVSSEEKMTEETIERPLDTMTQELLESVPTSEEEVNNAETPTETTDSIDEPEAPIDIEPPAPTPETLSAPRAVTTVLWGQTKCTIVEEGDYYPDYTIYVRAGGGNYAGSVDSAPWKWYFDKYQSRTKRIIFDGSAGKIHLSGDKGRLFSQCSSLEYVDLSGADTSNTENMAWMFQNCTRLKSINFSGVKTREVTSMQGMFENCNSISYIDVSNFDTRNVTNMERMFLSCHNLDSLNLTNFTTNEVTNMKHMFNGCERINNLNFSNFDVSKVTDMSHMFENCISLSNISFGYSCNTSNVENMSYMFYSCAKLSNLNLNCFDTSKVTNMSYMFSKCYAIKNLSINKFDTSRVTDMEGMFENCNGLQNISLDKFNTSRVTNMNTMFYGCKSLYNLNLDNFNTSRVTDMSSMISRCDNLSHLDLSNFDTSKVKSMKNMLSNNPKLESIDLSSFDTSEVTEMGGMFGYNPKLESIDLSSFDTSKVTEMGGMFSYCINLKSLDLSNFNTNEVRSMLSMFSGCNQLRKLILGEQTKLQQCGIETPTIIGTLFTGKWTTIGNGTIEKPRGDWSGTPYDLIVRSQEGIADTYVWETRYLSVVFDGNGGQNVPSPIKAYKGDQIELSTVRIPTPPSDNYLFNGWSTILDDPSTIIESFVMPNKSLVVLYANWKMKMHINSVPDNIIFKNNVMPNEYYSQIISVNPKSYSSKNNFETKWRGDHNWKLTVTMAEWCNPDDNTDTLTGVQMFMNNQLTHQDGAPAPSTIHSNQQVVLNAGETQTLVTTTAGNSADGTGNWQSTIDFDSVKLKIPRYGGREGSYYTSQLTWSLDDTI